MSFRSVFSAVILSALATPVLAEAPRVVTDIAPIQGLVARVMAGVAEPDVLVPPGSSPHSYSLRPSDARALSSADAVFWIGDALEPWLEESITQLAGQASVTTLLEAPGTQRLMFRQEAVFGADEHDGHDHEAHRDHDDGDHDGHDHEGHDAHGHEGHDDHDHAGAEHHGHDHHGIDPHAWLAPENGKVWLALIAEELSRIDPENAEIYQSNALAGQAEIDQVVQALAKQLQPGQGRFVVFHDAYQYFEASFGVESLGAISLGDASDPSVARIAELRDAVADADIACVFSEPQFNAGLVQAVTEGIDVKSIVIDPLGTEIASGPMFYENLLADIGADYVTCLAAE